MGIDLPDPVGVISDAVGGIAGDAASAGFDAAAQKISEAVSSALTSTGTMWINIGTPELTGGSSGTAAGTTPPGAAQINTLLSWSIWVSLGVCVLGLIVAGVRFARPYGHVDPLEETARVGRVLVGVILISGSSALISALMRARPTDRGASESVAFIQNGLWFYVLALAMVSVIVAGAKMAWDQDGRAGRELVRNLIQLALVSSVGIAFIGVCIAASDAFAQWIIERSLNCDAGTSCFGKRLEGLLGLSAVSGLGAFMVIVLGFFALVTSLIQIAMMVARGGMLVILTGILPLSAAATNTEMGRSWFKKNIAWLAAFTLYKPAAAIVYATAFKLAGTNLAGKDGLISTVTGLMLMVLAVVALPAMMRFVTPVVGAMAAGGGGAMAGVAAAVPAMGAVSTVGRWASSGTDSGGAGSAPSSPSGAATSSGGGQPPTQAPGGSGSSGSSPSGAAGAARAQGGAQAAGAGGAAASGSAAGGAAAGGAVAGGGAAAVAGPAGIAVAAAAQGAKKLSDTAGQAATSAADGATATPEGGI